MDTEKWKSVLVPREVYENIVKDAKESGRTISGQLKIIYERSKKYVERDATDEPVVNSGFNTNERALEIYKLVTEDLMTFRAIGNKFNLSLERVRQIFKSTSEQIELNNLKGGALNKGEDLEDELAKKYQVSRKDIERLLSSLKTENKKRDLEVKIGTLTLSKNLENFLKVNELMELPVSDFLENVEELRIEDYEKFSIFHIFDLIDVLATSGYENHLKNIRAHAKKLAKALTQNPS